MKLPKNNESTTVKSDASELGPPTPKDAALANVGPKIVNKSECVKRLGELFVKTACFFCSFTEFVISLQQNLQVFRYDNTTNECGAVPPIEYYCRGQEPDDETLEICQETDRDQSRLVENERGRVLRPCGRGKGRNQTG